MNLHIDVELQGGLLLVTASGTWTFDAAFRAIKQVRDAANEKEVNKILVNALGTNGDLPTVERYRLGVELAARFEQHHMNPRLAFIGKPPAMNGFAVRVAQNRGLTTEIFSTEKEALNWLGRWPG